MTIMSFGGGAMIGSPLADLLMNHFETASSAGVWQTFVTLAVVYLARGRFVGLISLFNTFGRIIWASSLLDARATCFWSCLDARNHVGAPLVAP